MKPIRPRDQRHAADARELSAAVDHFDAIWQAVEEVATAIGPGQAGCAAFAQDVRIAREAAARIDAAIDLPGLLEVLDGPVIFGVCLIVAGVRRAAQQAKTAEREAVARRLLAKQVTAAVGRAVR